MNPETRTIQSIALPHLRAWRIERCLAAGELARAAGISPGMVTYIETGRRHASFRTVGRLATVLGITREQLRDTTPA